MSAPLALPATVPPLVARLGSDADGERLACLRQIDRVLSRVGMSWTDLARRLEGAGAEPCRPAGPATCWAEAVAFTIEHGGEILTDRDREFLWNMRDLIGRGFPPTERQSRWLRSLFERAGGAWAEEAA